MLYASCSVFHDACSMIHSCYSVHAMHYLDGLNERQKEAVMHTKGPLLIVAGAGAGKTRVITHRILHLIKQGVAPESILAITFTNKAAREMRERVHRLISKDSSISDFQLSTFNLKLPWLGTFHSLGVHILRENSQRLGLAKRFTIFDRGDSIHAVKEAIKETDLDPKSFEPGKILGAISREKGKMVTCEMFKERVGGEYFPGIVAEVWEKYEMTLKKEKALDFDDLLLKTALLLEKEPAVRAHYQKLWRYIHIDEYQDTNHVQYMIAKLLAEDHKNIAVVGDGDQCFLPGTCITTSTGIKKISEIHAGELITSAAGNGSVCGAKVDKVRIKKYDGETVEITTESGKIIICTPQHILFANLVLTENKFYVYLMYRRDKGFRVGMAKSLRQNGHGQDAIGLLVRCNQEKADKMWVLKVCDSKREALYFETYIATSYGLPTLVFLTGGRKMAIEQEDIDALFNAVDTRERVQKLFKDTGLHFDYPHYFPQGTTQSNTARERINVRLTLFGDRRKSVVHPWGMSRVSINTTDVAFKRILETSGFPTRKGKRNDWRLEIARLDYGEAERIASHLSSLKPNTTAVRTAFLTRKHRMLFHPASNIIPGMTLAVLKDGEVVGEKVISVNRKSYKGEVYDLDIANVHNYIANDIVVHNCIYSWRGASMRNLLGFEKDFPNAKTVLLEENYRSTQTILTVANRVIKKNKLRIEKTLFTKNGEGEKVGLFTAYDEAHEASFIAKRSKQLIGEGVSPAEIAVLFRANFQSRALEEAFLREEVPYQVLGVRFFERKEIKDILAYVRAAETASPEANAGGKIGNLAGFSDIQRIINVPPRGIGKVTLLKIFAGKEEGLPPAMRGKIHSFRKLLTTLREKLGTLPLSEAIKWIVVASGIEAELKKGGAEDEERLENIKELVTFATRYDHLPNGETREANVDKFLSDVALQSDQDELKDEKPSVRLMTVHSSKGLEFEFVFVAGLEEGLFPHERMDEMQNEGAKEEERRLFYVALTRAKKKVFLTYAGVRTIFGSRQVTVPSEFIFDIDEEFLQAENEGESGGKIIFFD